MQDIISCSRRSNIDIYGMTTSIVKAIEESQLSTGIELEYVSPCEIFNRY